MLGAPDAVVPGWELGKICLACGVLATWVYLAGHLKCLMVTWIRSHQPSVVSTLANRFRRGLNDGRLKTMCYLIICMFPLKGRHLCCCCWMRWQLHDTGELSLTVISQGIYCCYPSACAQIDNAHRMCVCVCVCCIQSDLPDGDCRFDHRSFLWRHGVAWLEILATEKKIIFRSF